MSQEKTFSVQSPADFFAKLQWEFARLKGIDPSLSRDFVYQSITCASDAWHMTDWVFNSLPYDRHNDFPDVRAYRRFAQKDSPDLAICREIADASKHSKIDAKPNPEIRTGFVRTPDPRSGVDGIWWFVVANGKLRDIREVIDGAVMYWCRTLDSLGLANETPYEEAFAHHRSLL
ncbi:hypothetical protein [Paraburkholderia sacchari]|uniref:hypothetical protein n=1 Tax=Paraburkholderia sacchari TaxID=159450 RepID=UPI001BCF771A|nr:hypothetical protein [Paraburkholderia sacchari]